MSDQSPVRPLPLTKEDREFMHEVVAKSIAELAAIGGTGAIPPLQILTTINDLVIPRYEATVIALEAELEDVRSRWLPAIKSARKAGEITGRASLRSGASPTRQSYVMAMAILQSKLYHSADSELRDAVDAAIAASHSEPADATETLVNRETWPPCNYLSNTGNLHPDAKPPCNGNRCVLCVRPTASSSDAPTETAPDVPTDNQQSLMRRWLEET